MIEDKDVKIAETREEALWERVRKQAETDITNLEDSLMVQKQILEMAVGQLKLWKK